MSAKMDAERINNEWPHPVVTALPACVAGASANEVQEAFCADAGVCPVWNDNRREQGRR